MEEMTVEEIELCRCCEVAPKHEERFCSLCNYLVGRQFPRRNHHANDRQIAGLDEKIAECLEDIEDRLKHGLEIKQAIIGGICDILEREYFPLDRVFEVPPETAAKFRRYSDWGAELLLKEPLDLGPMGIVEPVPDREHLFLHHFGNPDNCLPLYIGAFRLGRILQAVGLKEGRTEYPLHALLPTIATFGGVSRTRRGGYHETPWEVLTTTKIGKGTVSNLPIHMLPDIDLSLIELYEFPALSHWRAVLERGRNQYWTEADRTDAWLLGLSNGILVNDGNDWEFKNLGFLHFDRDQNPHFGLTIDWGDIRSLFLLSSAALCPPSSAPFRLLKAVIDSHRIKEIEHEIRPAAPLKNSLVLLHSIMQETDSTITKTPESGILLQRADSGAAYLVSQCEFYWRIHVRGISNAAIRGRNPIEIGADEWRDICAAAADNSLPIGDKIGALLLGLKNDVEIASEIDDVGLLINDSFNKMSRGQTEEFQREFI